MNRSIYRPMIGARVLVTIANGDTFRATLDAATRDGIRLTRPALLNATGTQNELGGDLIIPTHQIQTVQGESHGV